MSWAARVRDVFSGDEAQKKRLHEAFLEIYSGLLSRRAQIQRHAESAPSGASRTHLERLAERLAAAAAALRTDLDERGVTVRSTPSPVDEPAETSHWARVVADLEAERAARDQILTALARFADEDPRAAALLEVLVERVDEHCSALRAEIARADPQARD